MNGLILFSLANPRAITVLTLTLVIAGAGALALIPADILPAYRAPAVQILTFYNGMAATGVEAAITSRMERGTGQAPGMIRQESRSLLGVSVIRNFYADDIDPNSALTQVNSLATTEIPTLPPGTLPPVILPYDPTSSTPVALVALNSKTQNESTLYDTGRYQVRVMIMASRGANAPVVFGGKIRTILAYLDRDKMQARNLSPIDVMQALDRFNIFLPAGDVKIGDFDYTLDSNSMYSAVKSLDDLPVKTDPGRGTIFLKEVATTKDDALIQTNIVRVDGRRQVYIPVYRQAGYSTLSVVNGLKKSLPEMKAKLTTPDIDLQLVMDQSVYVRKAIESLAEEGILGAILCSLVILIFLGEWKMTVIAVMTIPVAVLGAMTCLFALGQSVNVMTLAGLSLAVGPLVDSAIICLENTHRHLGLGAEPEEAAFRGASEVAVPELVASLCTLLVLLPLALMPGLGGFLFRPMFLAVASAMAIAYLLSRTFVPARCAAWLRKHRHPAPAEIHGADFEHRNPHEHDLRRKWWISRAFERWETIVNSCISVYLRVLEMALRARVRVIAGAFTLLLLVLIVFGSGLRREFFPEVDAGSFEVYVRAPSGTRVEQTEQKIAGVETYVKEKLGADLELVISEIGLTANWSAAYTPNAGPMDAVVKIQLKSDRNHSAQEYVQMLRTGFASDPRFANLEFSFDSGGMIRTALNEGSSTPLNVRVTGKDKLKARKVAERILAEVRPIPGVVDARIVQRLDYPQYVLEVNQAKASEIGLTQADIMKNVVSAFNSSVQFNKLNFWIDPKSFNNYFVGVQYPEEAITSLDTLLDIPITGPGQKTPIPLRTLATIHKTTVPAEINHTDLQSQMDLTMGTFGRDLGHVAEDVKRVVARFGQESPDGSWVPFEPDSTEHTPMEGAKIIMSGEYQKMLQTFRFQALGMIGAVLLVYFLMVALFRSYVTPLVVLSAVPIGSVGVVLMLSITGTAVNVQSLLGVIFMVGIVVSNTVLLTDFAENVRRTDRVKPIEAIRRAAAVRVRPVVMTALATLFALIPMSLGISRGSEANVPLGRAVLGGLIAGLATTLLVVPCVYTLLVSDRFEDRRIPSQ